MVMRMERMTVNVPRDLVELTNIIAKEKNISRSKLVSACLREMANKRLEEEMIEGYKAMSKANLKFAEESLHLASEWLPKE
jgi:metal-responsive CopG/Arc/MetJ family transcriptional regulator